MIVFKQHGLVDKKRDIEIAKYNKVHYWHSTRIREAHHQNGNHTRIGLFAHENVSGIKIFEVFLSDLLGIRLIIVLIFQIIFDIQLVPTIKKPHTKSFKQPLNLT